MIVYRSYVVETDRGHKVWRYSGYYLIGLVPIYLSRILVKQG